MDGPGRKLKGRSGQSMQSCTLASEAIPSLTEGRLCRSGYVGLRTHAYTHTHTHTHTLNHTHTHSHTYTHAHAHTHTHARAHTLTHIQPRARAPAGVLTVNCAITMPQFWSGKKKTCAEDIISAGISRGSDHFWNDLRRCFSASYS